MIIVEDTIKLIEKMELYDKRSGKWINFNLWPKQVEFLDTIHNNRKVITLKKRQTGMSQLTGADSLPQCMILHNFTTLVLSKTGPDAEEYLRRVISMYSRLPEFIRHIAPTKKINKDEIEFHNGSRIVSLPANRGAGFTADRVVVDEAAFITKQETKITLDTVLKRVEPTLDKAKGQLILISTANGRNTFWEYWEKASQGKTNFVPFFFSCWDDPTFSREERANIEKDHGEDHANQEYPRDAKEAFLYSGRPRFNTKVLQEYENEPLQPIFKGFLLHTQDELIPDDKGNFELYRKKNRYGQYFIVADVAEGVDNELSDPDYSHAKVYDYSDMAQIAAYHDRLDAGFFGSVLWRMGRMFNNALIVCERNNDGKATLTQLANVHQYPHDLIFEHNLMVTEKSDSDYKDPVPRYGWITTSKTRPMIISNLAEMITNKEINGLSKADCDELTSFVIKNGKTQAGDAAHDDRVMVLAIAHYLMCLDVFYIHYPISERKKGEICISCEHSDPEGNICTFTGKTILNDSWCSMYNENELDINEFNNINIETGMETRRYIPMKRR